MRKISIVGSLILTLGCSAISPAAAKPKQEAYSSNNTIGLASESPSKHSRAWISNISNDEMQRVAGTYTNSKGEAIAFAVAFEFGNHEPCLYIENSSILFSRKTFCHAGYSKEDRLAWVFVQLATGNTMIIRYDPRTSTQETMRFLNLWQSLYGSLR